MRVFDGSSVAVEMVSATELVASRGRREESLAPPRRGRVGGNAAVTAAAYCVRKLYSYSQPGHRQTLRSQLTDTRSNSSETDSRKRVGTRHARLTGYPPMYTCRYTWYNVSLCTVGGAKRPRHLSVAGAKLPLSA